MTSMTAKHKFAIVCIVFTMELLLARFISADQPSNVDIVLVDAMVQRCTSPDRTTRENALQELSEMISNEKTVTQIVDLLIEKIESHTVPRIERNSISMEQRRELIRSSIRTHEITIDIFKTFCLLDSTNAHRCVIENAAYSNGSFSLSETCYIDNRPVSAFPLAYTIIKSSKIQYKSIIQILIEKGTIVKFPESFAPVMMFILLEKLKQKGMEWEKGKRIISCDLEPYWEKSSPSNDPDRDIIIRKLQSFCNDPELTEINARRPG